jgi:hypothetical protein
MLRVLCLAAVFVSLSACTSSVEEGSKMPKRVSASSLMSGECEIIGRLGKPYGEIAAIRGVWKENPPETVKELGMYSLIITTVDGRKLGPSDEVDIPGMFVDFLSDSERPAEIQDGDVYDGAVFESGKYVRAPQAAYALLGDGNGEQVADNYDFRFYSFVYLIRNNESRDGEHGT